MMSTKPKYEPEADRKKICAWLKEQAELRDLTYGDIAAKTGFIESNISRMLAGKYPPTLDNLLILADAIGVRKDIFKNIL